MLQTKSMTTAQILEECLRKALAQKGLNAKCLFGPEPYLTREVFNEILLATIWSSKLSAMSQHDAKPLHKANFLIMEGLRQVIPYPTGFMVFGSSLWASCASEVALQMFGPSDPWLITLYGVERSQQVFARLRELHPDDPAFNSYRLSAMEIKESKPEWWNDWPLPEEKVDFLAAYFERTIATPLSHVCTPDWFQKPHQKNRKKMTLVDFSKAYTT